MLAIIERLLLLAVVVGLVAMVVRQHPFFHIPLRWRWLGTQDAALGKALALRAGILDLLQNGRALHAGGLVRDIDDLVRAMADIVEVRRALGVQLGRTGREQAGTQRLRDAIGRTKQTLAAAHARLEDLRAALLEQATLDTEMAVDEARTRFRERAEQFGYVVEAQLELKAELQQMRGR
ncbi:MAG: hypothetical protein EXR79_15735 [Myxococcales bacterium]|nr:hypothetical protein [Myxococcales bacterium]